MEDGNQSMAMNETLFCDYKDAISVWYLTPVHEGKPLGESCCDQVALIFGRSILLNSPHVKEFGFYPDAISYRDQLLFG